MEGERTSEQSGERTSEQSGERTSEQSGERTSEQYGERTSEQYGERTSEQYGERTSEQYGERTSEQNDNDTYYDMWREEKSTWPMLNVETEFVECQNDGPRVEQDQSNLLDGKSSTSVFTSRILKCPVASEACESYRFTRAEASPNYNLMNSTQHSCEMNRTRLLPSKNGVRIFGNETLPDGLKIEKQRRDALTSNLDGRQKKLPFYPGAMPMNSEIRRYQSLPVPDVADLSTSPYQQQFYANAQAPSSCMSAHDLSRSNMTRRNLDKNGYHLPYQEFLNQQQLQSHNNGSKLLQSRENMNSAFRHPFFQNPSNENSYAMDGTLHQANSTFRYSFLQSPNENSYAKDSDSYVMDSAFQQGCRDGNQNSRRKNKNLALPYIQNGCYSNDLQDWHDLESLRSGFNANNRSPSIANYVGTSFNRSDYRTHFTSNRCFGSHCHNGVDTSVDDVMGRIFYLAMDQCGCLCLEKILTEGSPEDIGKIFIEISDHIIELMVDPSGNILVKKLLEVCNEEQRMQIIRAITRDAGILVRISCDTHGSRAVQKVIETLHTIEQISIIVSSLQLVIVPLMKNTNGNHVLQCCLRHFPFEFKEHLYDAAIAQCAELAVDRQACFVLQNCIRNSEGSRKNLLMYEICSNSYFFSQDPFGNYVVKCVIEQEVPWATTIILGQLEGKYEDLAIQKYSSNVVEECLKRVNEECLAQIVHEMISSPHFLEIALDQYGNYVIQTALKRCKGALLYDLVEAIKPHMPQLGNHQYGKKVANPLRKICFKLGFGVGEDL